MTKCVLNAEEMAVMIQIQQYEVNMQFVYTNVF